MDLAVHAFEVTRTAHFLFYFYEQRISTVINGFKHTLHGTRYTQATGPEQTRLPKKKLSKLKRSVHY